MKYIAGLETAAKKFKSDGVKLALTTRDPCIAGFHVHDAVKFGEEPEVATFWQFGMRLPSTKNRTNPGAVTLTVIVELDPFRTEPDIEGAPKDAGEENPATPL